MNVLLPGVDGVILSDYAKGTLTAENCQQMINAARQAGLPILVDPKGRDFQRYRGATTICPNLKELALAMGESDTDLDAILDHGKSLSTELGLDYLTVTLGEKGIAVLHGAGRFHAPAIARQVFDVSGAGDTVIATLAVAIASGIAIEDAARLANHRRRHRRRQTRNRPDRPPRIGRRADRVFRHGDAAKKFWTSIGSSCGSRNGALPGTPSSSLTAASISCMSATSLSSKNAADSATRSSSGSTAMPRSPASKDLGVPSSASANAPAFSPPSPPPTRSLTFDAPTPIELITALRPDVLVKGGDYTEENIVGAPEVRRWGGRVVIVPTVQGFSTTNIARKLAQPAHS